MSEAPPHRAPGDGDPTAEHPHLHVHNLRSIALGKLAARVVVGLLGAIGVAVVIGLIVLWPAHFRVTVPGAPAPPVTETAVVAEQILGDCDYTPEGNGAVTDTKPTLVANPDGGCLNSSAQLTSGPDSGKWVRFSVGTQRVNIGSLPGQSGTGVDTSKPATPGTGQPDLTAGTKIVVSQSGAAAAGGMNSYSFLDYSRGVSLWVWGLVFAAVVIAVAMWRGLRALIGLALSGVVIMFFALPSILEGHSAVWVAMVGSALILYIVLYLAHGISLRTSAALLGTLTSLALCGVLSWLAVMTTSVTGLSSEDATNLQAYAAEVSISGVLLAGFVIGALGVLNDVTITQASTVFELASLSPKSSRRRTFFSAMRVGRDHIASTVYTLVFAYVGSALPLLLLFTIAGRPLGQVLTSDTVAVELTRAFVGGIGLALSVPLTTAIAVLLAKPTRSTVSQAAVDRYTEAHPDREPKEVRVRNRPQLPVPAPSTAQGGAAPSTPRPAPAPSTPQRGPAPSTTRRNPEPPRQSRPPETPGPSGPSGPPEPPDAPRRGRHYLPD